MGRILLEDMHLHKRLLERRPFTVNSKVSFYLAHMHWPLLFKFHVPVATHSLNVIFFPSIALHTDTCSDWRCNTCVLASKAKKDWNIIDWFEFVLDKTPMVCLPPLPNQIEGPKNRQCHMPLTFWSFVLEYIQFFRPDYEPGILLCHMDLFDLFFTSLHLFFSQIRSLYILKNSLTWCDVWTRSWNYEIAGSKALPSWVACCTTW